MDLLSIQDLKLLVTCNEPSLPIAPRFDLGNPFSSGSAIWSREKGMCPRSPSLLLSNPGFEPGPLLPRPYGISEQKLSQLACQAWPIERAAKLILCKACMFPIAEPGCDFEAALGLPLMW